MLATVPNVTRKESRSSFTLAGFSRLSKCVMLSGPIKPSASCPAVGTLWTTTFHLPQYLSSIQRLTVSSYSVTCKLFHFVSAVSYCSLVTLLVSAGCTGWLLVTSQKATSMVSTIHCMGLLGILIVPLDLLNYQTPIFLAYLQLGFGLMAPC